jgi:predicted nucleic acid-binding protein
MTFKSEKSPEVEILHEYDPSWEVPILWRSEFLNVLSLYYKKKLIDYSEVIDSLEFAEKLIGDREHDVSSLGIIDLFTKCVCSSYDCEFISLAKTLNTKLITFDNQILKEFPDFAIKPQDYLPRK